MIYILYKKVYTWSVVRRGSTSTYHIAAGKPAADCHLPATHNIINFIPAYGLVVWCVFLCKSATF